MKYTRQLADAPAGSFHVLDEEKAKRLNAKTLYIPSPLEVRDVISAIPSGTVWKVVDMRRKLAADTTPTRPALQLFRSTGDGWLGQWRPKTGLPSPGGASRAAENTVTNFPVEENPTDPGWPPRASP